MQPSNPLFDRTKGQGYDKQFQPGNVPLLEHHPRFVLAMANVPDADIACVQAKQQQENVPAAKRLPLEHIICMLAMLRWQNPICEQCFDKSDPGKLFACERCGLAFYCSPQCQLAHAAKHAVRCCRRDAPLDDGPQALAFGKIQDK